MLTFLTSPKPFIEHVGKIQRDAIRSWLAVHSDIEVIIYGDGEGVSKACADLGVCHVPDTPCSPSGIPYFNGIVGHARIYARHDVQCYINCDILMTEDVIKAVKLIVSPSYLVVGQRIDLAQGVEIDVTTDNWKNDLQRLTEDGNASLHAPTGMDYFIFNRGVWAGLLSLVIGRGGYDNALLAFCLKKRIPIIDATNSITALHQFHDYRHVSGEVEEVMHGKEARANMRIHGVLHSAPIVTDADYQIDDRKRLSRNSRRDRLRALELYLRFQKRSPLLGNLIRGAWRLVYLGRRVFHEK